MKALLAHWNKIVVFLWLYACFQVLRLTISWFAFSRIERAETRILFKKVCKRHVFHRCLNSVVDEALILCGLRNNLHGFCRLGNRLEI